MTSLLELINQRPTTDVGIPVDNLGLGWRWAVEIADPALGSSVRWHDITCYCAGVTLTRGASGYLGKYQAAVADIMFTADDDRLAPWNSNTSAAFGTHVDLGAGLLVRASIFSDAVWYPRFTHRVEEWKDSTAAEGKLRTHLVTAVDLMSGLVNVPVAARGAQDWEDRLASHLTSYLSGGADWDFGYSIYGAIGYPTLPEMEAAVDSAISAVDDTVEPVGIIFYSTRRGALIFRPQIGDTFHADRFDAGAPGIPWPERQPFVFSYRSCDDGNIAYATSGGSPTDQFGINDSERSIINHIRVVDPDHAVPYEYEDPISIQRFGRETTSPFWQVLNTQVAQDIVNIRAYAHRQANPLTTSLDLDNFHTSMAKIDYLDPVQIRHRTGPGRQTIVVNGVVRALREDFIPRVAESRIGWESEVVVDVLSVAPTDDDLLPVTGLQCSEVTTESITWTWSNPSGQPATPTETQVRLLPNSPLWLTRPYPGASVQWLGLDFETPYRLEVRLVRRDADGLITHVSPARAVTCTTLPEPEGPTNPGPGDGDENCYWEWEMQESCDGPTGPWTLFASGTRYYDEGIEVYPTADELNGTCFYRVRENDICGEDGWTDWSDPVPGGPGCQSVAIVPDVVTPGTCDVPEMYPLEGVTFEQTSWVSVGGGSTEYGRTEFNWTFPSPMVEDPGIQPDRVMYYDDVLYDDDQWRIIAFAASGDLSGADHWVYLTHPPGAGTFYIRLAFQGNSADAQKPEAWGPVVAIPIEIGPM